MRLLAKLDTKSNFVIKGVQLEGVQKLAPIGQVLHRLSLVGVQEFCLTDTMASLYSRNSLAPVIQDHTSDFRYPICAGGGIKSLDDAKSLILAGADRISVNTHALENPSFIGVLTEYLGNSCVVSQMDVRKIDGAFYLFSHAGRERSSYSISKWLEFLYTRPVGEILVTSIDRDGTRKGVDWELIELLEKESPIPYIYSGGLKSVDELNSLSDLKMISGVAALSCFIDDLV